MNIKPPFELLWDFQTIYDLSRSEVPALPDRNDPDGLSLRILRKKLLEEEYNEYLDGEASHDLVEIADALGDILYIAYGTVVSYGLSTGFEGIYPMPEQMIPGLPAPANVIRASSKERMMKAWSDYAAAEEADDLYAISVALRKIIDECYSISVCYGLPMHVIFAEIHRSNLSKLDPETGKPIYREDGKVLKGSAYTPPDISTIITDVFVERLASR